MVEFRSPLPEFSQLVVGASDAVHGLRKTPSATLTEPQKQAIRALIDFTGEYGGLITAELDADVH